MKKLKSINRFAEKWIQSWRTKPDFIIDQKALSARQVSGKYSFLNAFISGALSVRTLLSILVGVAGITSIAVYDIVINPESPLFAESSGVYDSETGNKDLLADLSSLLSSQPELPVNTEITVEPIPEDITLTEDAADVESDDEDLTEASPETGDNITALFFVSLSALCISAVIIFNVSSTVENIYFVRTEGITGKPTGDVLFFLLKQKKRTKRKRTFNNEATEDGN